MPVTYMQETIKNFYKRLDMVEKDLQNFSHDIDDKKKTTEDLLKKLQNDSEEIKGKYAGNIGKNESKNAVTRAAQQTVVKTRETILNCQKEISEFATSQQEFMNKHEKRLVAMVFGQVKVGKSCLGNFIAGKYFADAEFDNEYKHRAHPLFEEEKSGREGGIITDELSRQWFKEGLTDTTGAIQYFTLSGLRWFDSPGTGAVKLEGDTLDMNGLVDRYITFADMGIFLMNSSEPGLQVDMKYIQKMKELGKDTLVIITRSDKSKPVKVNGKYGKERIWVPKPIEDREKQEKSITNDIDKEYGIGAEYLTKKYKVISVSTKLAANAIAQKDDELFKDSHLDQFMNILGEIASEEAITLKMRNPRRAFNKFIDIIIKGEQNGINGTKEKRGLNELVNLTDETLKTVKDFRESIEKRTSIIQKNVIRKAKREVHSAAITWEKEVNDTGQDISAKELSNRINAIAGNILKEELSEEISKIISDFEIKQIHPFELQLSEGVKKEKQIIKQKYKEHVLEERDPDGIIEHIKGFFGHTYYQIVVHDREKEIVEDIGTNIDKIYDSINEAISTKIAQTTKEEMNLIAENYFKPQEKYAKEMRILLQNVEGELEKLKFRKFAE